MSHALHPTRRPELPMGWIAFLEVLLFAPLAALVVLGIVPAAFGIEWECTTGYGIVRTSGDTYLAGFAVTGAAGWLAVAAGVVFALATDRRRAAVVLPLALFALLVLSSVITAAAIGPASCPAPAGP